MQGKNLTDEFYVTGVVDGVTDTVDVEFVLYFNALRDGMPVDMASAMQFCEHGGTDHHLSFTTFREQLDRAIDPSPAYRSPSGSGAK